MGLSQGLGDVMDLGQRVYVDVTTWKNLDIRTILEY